MATIIFPIPSKFKYFKKNTGKCNVAILYSWNLACIGHLHDVDAKDTISLFFLFHITFKARKKKCHWIYLFTFDESVFIIIRPIKLH